MDLDYDPIQPKEGQKAVYGRNNAIGKARDRWLQRAAGVISSGQWPEVEQAYRQFARSNGFQEELARAVLIHDISVSLLLSALHQSNSRVEQASPIEVRERLAQNLVLLYLSLAEEHSSFAARTYLASHQDSLLDSLQFSLQISVPPKRTRRDEAQVTSLVRALLESSGGRVDVRQHGFAEEYTIGDNADFYASLLGIAATKDFELRDPEEIQHTLSESPVFSGVTFSVKDLEDWIMTMRKSLRVGFREGYLVRDPKGRSHSKLTTLGSSAAGVKKIRRRPNRNL